MKKNNLIDKIIAEPLGGAHRDKENTYKIVQYSLENPLILKKVSIKNLTKQRMDKFCNMGVVKK